MPYMRYVISSGLGVLLVFGFVAGTALYAAFVENIPANFPVRELMWMILSPLAAYMTFRTYLVPGDAVFMLRIEHLMKPYLQRSIRSSLLPRLMFLLAGWCILWPLYIRADESPKGFILSIGILIVIKVVVTYGAWAERHILDKRNRTFMRLLRYAYAMGACAAWLWMSAAAASLGIAIAGLAYIAISRTIPKLHFAWEAHIDAERTQVSRIHTFLSGFVDVPAIDERRFSRPWLSWVGNRFAFRQDQAYRYLLSKTFSRSEVFGIWLRLTVLGFVLLWWTKGTEWNVLLLLLFLIAIGAQCNALFHQHRYDVWRVLYPLAPGSKQRAARQLGTELQALSAFLLYIPVVLGATSWTYKLSVAAGAIAVIYASWLKRGGKRYTDPEDDE